MNSKNKARDWTQPSHDDEVNIPVDAEVTGVFKTDEQRPKYPPGPPVDVFTTTVSNVSQFLVAEILTKSGTLSSVGVEKISSKFGGYWTPVAGTNLELPQEYPICDFAPCLPEKPDRLYLNMVGIPIHGSYPFSISMD